jgi:hypothetical protein
MRANAGDNHLRGYLFRTNQNLALVAWRRAAWSDLPKLKDDLKLFRSQYPTGSAVLNLIAADDCPGVATSWSRMAALFLSAGRDGDVQPIHLGTAHLFQSFGLRASATRVLFSMAANHGRDFALRGNIVARSIDDATDTLLVRLADAPVAWKRPELRKVIEDFTAVGVDHRTGASLQ